MNKLVKLIAVASALGAAALAVAPVVVADDAGKTQASPTITTFGAPYFYGYPGYYGDPALVEQAYMEAAMDQERDFMRQRLDVERQAREAYRDAYRPHHRTRFDHAYWRHGGPGALEDATRDAYKESFRQQLDQAAEQQAKLIQQAAEQQAKYRQQAEEQRRAAWAQLSAAARKPVEGQTKAPGE